MQFDPSSEWLAQTKDFVLLSLQKVDCVAADKTRQRMVKVEEMNSFFFHVESKARDGNEGDEALD